MSKKIVETMKCGRCQDKQPGSLKNNITYPPRGWKRYPDKGTTILLCKKCRQKFRKIFTMQWRVAECVATEQIPNNAFRVTVLRANKRPQNGKPLKPKVYHVPFSKETPTLLSEIPKWLATRLQCSADEIIESVPSVHLVRFLEPWFKKCFQAANYAVQVLYRQEEMPDGPEDKLVKLDVTAATKKVKKRFGQMSHIAESIIRHVTSKNQYRLNRYRVLKDGINRLLTYKIGYPVPIRDGLWTPEYGGQTTCRVQITLACLNGATRAQKFTVRLADGKNYDEYIKNFKKMVEPLPLEERIVPLNMRLSTETKADRPFASSKLYANMTVDAPKPEKKIRRGGTLYLTTGTGYLLAARVNNRRLWAISGDEVPKFMHGLKHQLAGLEKNKNDHAYKLGRLSVDNKFDYRTRGRRKSSIEVTRQNLVTKQRNKMDSLIYETVADIVGFAEHHGGGFDTVVLDDRVKKERWPKSFDWYNFFKILGQKLDERGIRFLDHEGNDRVQVEDEATTVEQN